MATFNTSQKYLDLYGLQLFWSKIREYVLKNATKVASSHGTVADKVESSLHSTSATWVNVTEAADAAGTTTYTVDDSNINKQFGYIDAQMAEIKANAGVTGIKVVDADNAEDGDFVKLTFDGSKNGEKGFEKGDVTITLDNSKLDAKVTELETADSNEAASREADVRLLAGTAYTAGTAGNVGSWAEDGSPTYKSITELSNRLVAIDNSIVTKVTVVDASEDKTKYVTLSSDAENGTGDITLTFDDTKLEKKIVDLVQADTDETTARKTADALLAGDGWDATNGNAWSSAPTYATIATLSQKLVSAEGKIDALSSATHFRGVVTALPEKALENLDYGDIIIVQADGASKEYIYNADPEAEGHVYSKDNWVELGDTKEEETRLSYLETWVGDGGATGSYITNADINAMFADGWSLPEAPANRK